jgi:hypothetical protein
LHDSIRYFGHGPRSCSRFPERAGSPRYSTREAILLIGWKTRVRAVIGMIMSFTPLDSSENQTLSDVFNPRHRSMGFLFRTLGYGVE